MSGRNSGNRASNSRQDQQGFPGGLPPHMIPQQGQQQQPYAPSGGPPAFYRRNSSSSTGSAHQFQGAPMPASPGSPQQRRLLQIQQQQLQLQQLQRQQQQQQRSNSYTQQQGLSSYPQQPPRGMPPHGQMAASPAPLQKPTVVLSPTAAALQQHQRKSPASASSTQRVASFSAGAMPVLPIPPAPIPAAVSRASSTAAKPSASTTTGKSKTPPPTSSTTTTAKTAVPKPKAAASRQSSVATSAASMTEEKTVELLRQCDWTDKTLWVARQVLGGQSVNGFLRATASVQRIKKQRARQSAQTKAKSEDGASSTVSGTAASSKKRGQETTTQAEEEALKKEVMNPRTAKKMKSEIETGLNFCAVLHGTIRSIIADMDPSFQPPPPLGPELPNPNLVRIPPAVIPPMGGVLGSAPTTSTSAASKRKSATQAKPTTLQRSVSTASQSSASSTGAASGSTLRKHRKKKLPPSNEPPVALSEFDDGGKRIFTKKEHTHRVFEVLRFRPLRQGDFVAARVSSRDLWILARVSKTFPGHNLPPVEFLALSEAKRDQLFRGKVSIKDVEDKSESAGNMVARSLVLPLPRSFSEAAEWGQRCKKGSRVYAMYPQTTSLYSATVVDNTTYCRDDDDIVVVEFDGDDPDPTGATPKHHIPARFVTLIPREFPGSQDTTKKKRRASQDAPTAAAPGPAPAPAPAAAASDPLDSMLMFDGPLDGFDDLEFDLLGGN